MPVALMWFLILLLGLASLFCNASAWLWIAAKWCRIPNVSYWRALAATLLLTTASIGMRMADLLLEDKLGMVLLLLGLYVIVSTACTKQVLRTTTRRALSAWLISLIVSSLAALPVIIPFKLFVIEAFTLPSGSMALAFIGKHFDVTCNRCGCRFPVAAASRISNEQRYFGARRDELQQASRCPNCGIERAITADQPVIAGDKILVDKIGNCCRWDPVVFRFPGEPSITYLDRLVGLPGETVEIITGDVFINERREAKPFGVGPDLWILLNDTRFRPSDMNADDPQWKADTIGSNWKWDQHGWSFSSASASSQALVFSGPTTDASPYAERQYSAHTLPADERALELGDLQVKCRLARFAGDGPFGFRWTFRDQEVTVRVMGDGDVELRTDHSSQKAHLPQQLSKMQSIGFAVRDGMAMLLADGQAIATQAVGPQDAATCRQASEESTKPCRIAITASHCDLALECIVLERDVYYRNVDGFDCQGCTGKPITLGPQEHFVLGDHSARANDSRYWGEVDVSLQGRYQAGAVPSELMIGVARCIYWPPARWNAMR